MQSRPDILSIDALSAAAQVGVNLAMDDRAAYVATTEPVIGTRCTTGYHPPDPTSGRLTVDPTTTTGMYPPDPIIKLAEPTLYAAS